MEHSMNALVAPTAADRSKFLGGSDAAAVLGLSPWETPVELWQAKTGRKPKSMNVDPAAEKRYSRGHRLEPFIREMAIDKLTSMGLQVELVACNERYVDVEHRFLSCEIDFELRLTGALVINGREFELAGEHINADAKSVTGFARKKWGEVDTEDVPIEYAAQFMHGLMVTGRRLCLVAALRSFDDVDIFWTIRDDETIAAMRPEARAVLGRSRAGRRAARPDGVRRHQGAVPARQRPGHRSEPGDRREGRAAARVKERGSRSLEEAEEALTFEIAEFISPHSRLTSAAATSARGRRRTTRALTRQALRGRARDPVRRVHPHEGRIRVLRHQAQERPDEFRRNLKAAATGQVAQTPSRSSRRSSTSSSRRWRSRCRST
jgi:hypothetical protein